MIWPSEWREVKRTPASKFKQLWVKLPSGIWLPTDKFICDAQMMPPIMGGSPGVVDKQVAASADDRSDKDNDTRDAIDNASLYVVSYTAGSAFRKHTGARFTGLGLSQGVTIDVAYAEVDVTGDDDPSCDIYCEDQQSPPNFADGSALVHDRTRTGASAEWSAVGIGTGWKQSPSLVGPVQEIATDYAVDTLALLFIGKEGDYYVFKLYSYDGSSTLAPKLHIEYSVGAPAYYHGLKVQGEGELALCDVGSHPLRIRKGGTTYGIELVAIDDPNASRIRIKTPAGIKAIRKYT